MLVDQQSNEVYIPLNDLGTDDGIQGHLEVWYKCFKSFLTTFNKLMYNTGCK